MTVIAVACRDVATIVNSHSRRAIPIPIPEFLCLFPFPREVMGIPNFPSPGERVFIRHNGSLPERDNQCWRPDADL